MNLEERKNAVISMLQNMTDFHLAGITVDKAGVHSPLDNHLSDELFKILSKDNASRMQ